MECGPFPNSRPSFSRSARSVGWGKTDSVGVLSNLFPMSVALYNIFMHYRSASSGDAPSHA
jgi:hypothetical protein